jgi:toxin ParE1/3/4
MTMKLARTSLARLDLVEIWNFIADDNINAADKHLDKIESSLKILADNPNAGRARLELGKDMRSFPIGNYMLFYRTIANKIELVRVLSSYRDIQSSDMN